ncbi:hypothetical protein PACTADRAFT_50852 [Pachysolen tannophilus NRRL Y-2460]|uniref:Uncharacterized protein n=1 Tax=Pachysolen tannophilus NRRL Y-2460 TaxID=669874 RepID=A0A1E4TTH2_PACTA|nr:hypothetical protein PACTADRAFT_50852 [Pachysolen tannophilus NRRL Y-2460]
MAPPPTLNIDAQAVSGITGSISIACWIIVFAPQIYENFIRKSSEGLSLLFVVLWLAGDVFNVLGAILQGVLPTMIILAIYYTLADIVLLWQCIVYGNHKNVDPVHLSPANPLNENDNLLENVLSNESDTEDNQSFSNEEDIESFIDTNGFTNNLSDNKWSIFYNCLMVVLVIIAGVSGWYFGNQKNPDDGHDHKPNQDLIFDPLAQIFGWLCAALYLGSRIPQILLNFKRKSCDGISFMFFLFACLGNLTYVISIFAIDSSKNYLLINSSWLAGSLGTLFLDFMIFVQFYIYNESNLMLDNESESFLVENDTNNSSAQYGSI